MNGRTPGHPSTATFDVVIVVDWSASSVPTRGRDSIWVAVRTPGAVDLCNPSTRSAARALLADVLEVHTGRRVLLALDVALGYPSGTTRAALGPADQGHPSWRRWWEHLDARLVDDPSNSNNRFTVAADLNAAIGPGPGPFWGTTTATATGPHLARRKGAGFPYHFGQHATLPEFRLVERALRLDGHRPASVWQLAGAGAVGSQSLTCIPVLEQLRRRQHLGRRMRIWPFETGLVAEPAAGSTDAVVVAEVWPTLCPLPDPWPDPVKDASQVLVLSEHLATLDRKGGLGAWFDPGLPDEVRPMVLDEEGWVLGARWPADRADALR